jgi:hypothetical protein
MLDLLENEIKVPVNSGAGFIPCFGIDATAEAFWLGCRNPLANCR